MYYDMYCLCYPGQTMCHSSLVCLSVCLSCLCLVHDYLLGLFMSVWCLRESASQLAVSLQVLITTPSPLPGDLHPQLPNPSLASGPGGLDICSAALYWAPVTLYPAATQIELVKPQAAQLIDLTRNTIIT